MADTLTPPAAPAAPHPAATAGTSTFSDDEAFGAIDAIGKDDGEPDPTPAPAPPQPSARQTPPRGDKGRFVPPTEKTPEKPIPPAPKPAEKPAEPPAEKMAPKELREAYEAIRKKHAELEKEHTEFKRRSTEPKEDPEKKTLTERLADREKRLADLQERLKYSDYSQTDEYKERYETPFVDAFIAGRNRVASLKIVEKKNDNEEVVRPARAATAEDFDALMKITDDDAAAEWAADHFGSKASMVLYHRERVQELNASRRKAVDDFRKNGSERMKQQEEGLKEFRKNFDTAIKTELDEAAKKYPKLFGPDEDPKAIELVDKADHVLARVIANGAPVKDGEETMTPPQLARAVAAIRAKAKYFDREAYRRAAAEKRVKALEAELAQYKASEPGPGEIRRIGGGKPAPGTSEGGIESAYEQMEREYSREGTL